VCNALEICIYANQAVFVDKFASGHIDRFLLPPSFARRDLLAARDHVLVKPDVIFPGQVDQARTIMQL
jgi:hypothetical protein